MAGYKYVIDKKEEPFVNPYNFVHIDFNIKSEGTVPVDKQELLTGWIKYTLIAKTPICIPDTESVEERQEHKSYNFMCYPDGKLMIPGSSVRGVIRNVYETATDSCFSTVKGGEGKSRQFITVRRAPSKDIIIKPGLIIRGLDGEWELYDADFYMLKSKNYHSNKNKNNLAPNREIWDSDKCPAYIVKSDNIGKYILVSNERKYSGDKVQFIPLTDEATGKAISFEKKTINKRTQKVNFSDCGKVAQKIVSDPNMKKAQKGILVIGEDVNSKKLKMPNNKHHERIFTKKGKVKSVDSETVKVAIEGLDATINVYNSTVNRTLGSDPGYHGGYKTYNRMKENGVIPVYYSNKNGNLYFQIAAIGRIAFHSDMNKLVGKKKPCEKREDLCKACSLFGMVGEEARGSRLRFSDLSCLTTEPVLCSRTLAEMGGPKVSYMPFYSNMSKDDNPKAIGYDDEGIELRGRKFYWHHNPSFDDFSEKKTGRNSTMQLAGAGTAFEGKVFFDGITNTELKELVWSLNFWHNDATDKYCHKIGHGKPLGLGSCKLIVDEICKREFKDNKYCITSIPINYAEIPPMKDTETVNDLLDICNFEVLEGKHVSYPYVLFNSENKSKDAENNAFASHKWFTENKEKRKGNEMMLLPYIDEDQSLHPFTAIPTGANTGNNKQRNGDRKQYGKSGNNRNREK